MASTTDTTKRTVIPSWKEYKDFADAGEMVPLSCRATNYSYFPLNSYVIRWKENQSLATAADLLSAAIMNGQTKEKVVSCAAKYILERKDSICKSLYSTASLIVEKTIFEKQKDDKNDTTSKIKRLNVEDIFKEKIKFLRGLIREDPYNALWYVELSRCYVNIGLTEKAAYVMRIAVHLAPNSRYVTRSAARMFLHSGDVDFAHHVLTNNQAFLFDPWLIASEIALKSAFNRNSKYIKKGQSLIASGKYSPFELTELLSVIGTQELDSSFKKGRLMLNRSLESPNDNSLAQAEWLLDRDKTLKLNIDSTKISFKGEWEAIAAFSDQKYEEALASSIDWISSMRFAKRPIYFATDMAYLYQDRYMDAISILEFGLKMNPNELRFKNNLAFAYALNNQISEAEKELDSLTGLLSNESELSVCATATAGLIAFRKGEIAEGRMLYATAIDCALRKHDKKLADKARLNLIREELIANPHVDKTILNPLDKLSTGDERETDAMKRKIRKLIQ